MENTLQLQQNSKSQLFDQNYDKIRKFYKDNTDKIKNYDKFQKLVLESNKDDLPFFDLNILGETVYMDEYYYQSEELIPPLVYIFNDIKDIKSLYNSRLKNLLLIKRGEIPLKNEFGSGLYDFLYSVDTNTILQNIKTHITTSINSYFGDNIILQLVDVKFRNNIEETYVDNNRLMIDVDIFYEIPFIGDNILKINIKQMELESQ